MTSIALATAKQRGWIGPEGAVHPDLVAAECAKIAADDPQFAVFQAAQDAQDRWHREAPALAIKLMRLVGGTGFDILNIDMDDVRGLLDMAAAVMSDEPEDDEPSDEEIPF